MSADLRPVEAGDERLLRAVEHLTAVLENLPNQLASLGTREAHVTTAMKHSRMLNATQVATLIDCDLRTLRRLVRAGSVPKPVHIGSLQRWRMGDIETWMEKKR